MSYRAGVPVSDELRTQRTGSSPRSRGRRAVLTRFKDVHPHVAGTLIRELLLKFIYYLQESTRTHGETKIPGNTRHLNVNLVLSGFEGVSRI